jgi:hypothetical protein
MAEWRRERARERWSSAWEGLRLFSWTGRVRRGKGKGEGREGRGGEGGEGEDGEDGEDGEEGEEGEEGRQVQEKMRIWYRNKEDTVEEKFNAGRIFDYTHVFGPEKN